MKIVDTPIPMWDIEVMAREGFGDFVIRARIIGIVEALLKE